MQFLADASVSSGRLPFTIGKSASDYSTQIITTGSGIVPIPYNEGLFIDYRHFDEVDESASRLLYRVTQHHCRQTLHLDSNLASVYPTPHSIIPT